MKMAPEKPSLPPLLSGIASVTLCRGASATTHTLGDTDNTVSYFGSINMTLYASYLSPGSSYAAYLENAIIDAGFRISTNASQSAQTRTFTIPSSYASGRYCVGVIYNVAEGSWKITNGITASSTGASAEPYALELTSGTIAYAPTGTYDVYIVPTA